MAKKYVFYANGIDLAKYPVTQNEKGVFYYNGSAYYKPTLDVFDTVKPPSGYLKHTDGSHAQYNGNPLRNPIDFSIAPGVRMTSNVDINIVSATLSDGAWVKTLIPGTDINPAFVHCYDWAKIGTTVKAGSIICKIAPQSVTGFAAHLHIDIWGKYSIRDLILSGNTQMANVFKIGDYVTFTGEMNLRTGAGDGFSVNHIISKDAVGRIKDGPRSSQNKLFYGKGSNSNINDAYTWFDVQFSDTTGWVAQTSRLISSNSTEITKSTGSGIVVPPEPPVELPDINVLLKQVADLKQENEGLKSSLAVSVENEKSLKGNLDTMEDELALLRSEAVDLQKKYDDLSLDRNRIRNELIAAIAKLNASLAMATTGEIFSELWKRVTRSIK